MSWIYDILKLLLLLILPFAMLIRASSYIHNQYAYPASISLLAASLATALLLFIYFSLFYGKFTGRFGSFDALKRRILIAVLLVAIYAGHGILFFSNANLKSDGLRSEINQLHPILRLSLSTLVYLDKELIITDASRAPEDYRAMGLPRKKASLHYKQKSSDYVHAVDLRTKGKSEVKNFLVRSFFKLMGFNTLRHTGTADHLHISLKSHDHPHAK